MADIPCDECPEKLLSQRVEKANELLNRCDNLRKTIEGLSKLRRKLFAELRFLKTVSLLCTTCCIEGLTVADVILEMGQTRQKNEE